MSTPNLEATEAECAAGRDAPRVSLTNIESAMERVFYVNGGEAALVFDQRTARNGPLDAEVASLRVLTICIVVMRNGFTVIGKSAPASAANYDRELGEKLAYEDAVRQIWPLMGFALRDRLTKEGEQP